MTVMQKKPDNPIAHLTAEDIETLGVELDAIRQEVIDTRGERDAAYIRKVIDVQRKLELGSRAVLLVSMFPPAWVVGTAGLSRRQDPREHGDRPQRPARPVGLDARPEDPLDHLGVGQRLARPSSGSTRTTSCTTRTRTSSARTTTSATASCASTRTSAGARSTSPSRCGTSSTPASSSTASRPTTSSSARTIKREADQGPRSSRRRAKQVLRQDPQAGRPRTTSCTRCCPARRSCRTLAANFTANLVRNLWTHSVIMCGHFPEGVETFEKTLDRGRDPRRVVPAPDARLGQHLRLARPCTS